MPECNVGVRTAAVAGRGLFRSGRGHRQREGVLVGEGTPAGVADRHHLGTRYGGWRGQHWYYRRPETKSDSASAGA